MAGSVVDYGFYLIQRGEAGHLRGCYTNEYKDCGGIETIGYGTVTRPGYNHLNYTNTYVTEEQAIALAKEEMAYKINEKCRTKFKDFDKLLPCYQAAILDTTYQGNWGAIQDAMNAHDMVAVYEAIVNNPNKERSAVRGRAIEMGMMIEAYLAVNPNADPKEVAKLIAEQMIEKYQYLMGTDCELTKDELALLYRSCMAAYGIEVPEEEITAFAMSYDGRVASGVAGIGSENMAAEYGRIIPQGPSYDGSVNGNGVPRRNGGYNGGYASMGSRYTSRYAMSGSSHPPMAYFAGGAFEPDCQTLEICTAYVSPNCSQRHQNPSAIVIHSTESPSLASTINTFRGSVDKTSAHYVIDRDGKIYQMVPEGMRANHAGKSVWNGQVGCNDMSIGIEIQRGAGQGYTPEQIASLMALTKDIQQRRGILPENTIGHADITPDGRKVDPGADFPWAALEAEGLAAAGYQHRGGGHEESYNPALNGIRSSDCQYFVLPDFSDEMVLSKTQTAEFTPADGRLPEMSQAETTAKSTSEKTRSNADKKRSEAQAMASAEAAATVRRMPADAPKAPQTTEEATPTVSENTEDVKTDEAPKPNSLPQRLAEASEAGKPKKKKSSSKGKKGKKDSDKNDNKDADKNDDKQTENTENSATEKKDGNDKEGDVKELRTPNSNNGTLAKSSQKRGEAEEERTVHKKDNSATH